MKIYKSYSRELFLSEKKMEYKRAKISCSADAADFARKFYHDDINIYESFFLILLNNSNNTIGHVKISQGGVTGTLVDAKIVLKYVIDTLAPAIILVHNHPSGKLKPSNADIGITDKIKKAAPYVDSKVLDHIILTEDSYYSFADEGIL